MKNSTKELLLELLRFGIIGVYGTIIDMAVEGWLTSFASSFAAGKGSIISFLIIFAVTVIGWLVATPATWSLTSIWGFRNVREDDAKKAKSVKGLLRFAGLAAIVLVIGALFHFLGYMILLEWSSLHIDIVVDFSFTKALEDKDLTTIFAWLVVFVTKTAITMVLNYLSRKFILYRTPKTEEKAE